MKLINLERERKKTGWTQHEAALKAGVARSTYANWENGKREPDFETAQKLADIFEVSVDYLRGQSEFRNADELARKYVELGKKHPSSTDLTADSKAGDKDIFVAYLGGPPKELDEEEAAHLERELEMFRAFREMKRREREEKEEK